MCQSLTQKKKGRNSMEEIKIPEYVIRNIEKFGNALISRKLVLQYGYDSIAKQVSKKIKKEVSWDIIVYKKTNRKVPLNDEATIVLALK